MNLKAQMRRHLNRNSFLRRLLGPFFNLRRLIIQRRSERVCRMYHKIFRPVKEGTLVVQLPTFGGDFALDARSHILRRILVNGCYEPEIVQILREHTDPERDVIDIGANIGLYTVFFAKILRAGQRVMAFEPAPGALRYLSSNLKRNKVYQQVILFEGVASAQGGNFVLNSCNGVEEYSSLKETLYLRDRTCEQIEVVGDTVDHLVEEYQLVPGLIKIDSEGAEFRVLTGALDTIQKYHPVIVAELSDHLLANFGTTSQEVIDLLEANQYKVTYLGSLDEILAIFCGEM